MEAKRVFDVAVSVAALIAGSPLWLAIAAVVGIDSGAPVIHRSTRVGRGGRPFEVLKFRTMEASAGGPGITSAGDARITRVGATLRRFRLDEAPQLINVLRGEMSMVGPRPEDPRYVGLYSESQRRALSVRPGIASPASIRYRSEDMLLSQKGVEWERHYVSEVLPAKLQMDLAYVEHHDVMGDLGILACALACLFVTDRDPPARKPLPERPSGSWTD